MAKRRPLDLHSLDGVIAEVIRLRGDGYTATGNWNLSQIGDHLSETMRIGMDGDEKRVAWPLRKVFGVILWLARRNRTMVTGAPTLPRLEPAEIAEDDPAKIDRLLATLAEARDFAGPLPPYPLMDGMTLEKWKNLMVIHAQHHLRFLNP
ncbi:MAG: DUF1569 domain-containing protein, partial [Planctomycetota bacterium]